MPPLSRYGYDNGENREKMERKDEYRDTQTWTKEVQAEETNI